MVLVLSNGDIVSVTGTEEDQFEDPYGEEIDAGIPQIEIVGSIDSGILAAKWSPDEEVLAIASNSNTFVLLSRIFEPIAEAKITSADHALSKHVSVGWGKKETQFQGRGARAQRDPTMPEKVDLGVLSKEDDRTVEISWRGDGEVVSVITIDKEPIERRTVRVYTRDGNLDSVSEPVDQLIGLVAWRPSGNLIASVQRHDDDNESPSVVFFERNGLRRGQFSLRIKPKISVLGLSWNSDSDCLAVCLSDRVQLWTTKNYHWYLKQEVSSLGIAPTKASWHPEKSHTLYITYDDGSIHRCEFQWDITRGPTAPPTDIGLVVVVDGQNINLTPLSLANTPPPMAFRSFKVPKTPTHVSVSRSNSRLAILSGFELLIAEWNPTDSKNKTIRDIKSPEIKITFQLDDVVPGIDAPKQISMIGNKYVTLVSDNENNTSDIITLKLITDENDNVVSYETIGINTVPEQVFLVKALPRAENAIFQTINGTILSFQGDLSEVATAGKLPRRCDAIEIYFPTEEELVDGGKPVIFGLHSNGRLYANDKQIATSATSMCMTDKYLAFTTAQNYLKFCHLAQPELISIPADTSADDERCRAIERGSLVVTAIPSKSAFTLQAPRGNLETFYPRIMTLSVVRDNIRDKRYDLAFSICRIHRIDLNILYDHSPEQFLENVELFIRQTKTTDNIDLFLSGLQESDVSKTKYKETIEELKQQKQNGISEQLNQLSISEIGTSTENQIIKKENVAAESKINKICDAILSVLLKESNRVEYCQSILTAYACKVPPALTDALTMIGKTRESDPELTNSSIQHLCFLQDVNLLYNTALGIYDLPLTLLIAQQSTKDPKEYLPFLRNLQSLEKLRRQFEIDTYLKRYSKALVHLADIGDSAFDELQDYVVAHDLYSEALNIFKYDTSKQDKIFALQASFLYSNTKYQQAGLVYEMLQDFQQALNSYMLGQCWQQALSIVERNAENIFSSEKEQGEDDVLTKTAQQLAEKTYETHNYTASATIQLEYLKNPIEACRILCKGFFFDEAIRIASKQKENVNKIIDSTIDPGLLDGFGQISELIADCNSQIKSQRNRIEELRLKKASDPLGFFGGYGGDDSNNLDAPDNVSIAASETSTAPSFFTKYTGKTAGTAKTGASRKTAKNRRREERKKARGKKGSVYEEEYLISSMGRLIDRLHETQPDALRLIDGLLRRGMRNHAHQIQTTYTDILEILAGCVDDVFTLSEKDRERYDDDGNIYYVPQAPIPVIKPFPKNDILNY